jgi:hypothetical protein
MAKHTVKWKKTPKPEDYAGAWSFLVLVFPDAQARKLVAALHKAATVERAAKDLLRASQLPLLAKDEPHVAHDLKRIGKQRPLAPVLLIRGSMTGGMALTIADGYHRICAVYYFDESAPIPCRLVDV